jgi:hypothetical protein
VFNKLKRGNTKINSRCKLILPSALLWDRPLQVLQQPSIPWMSKKLSDQNIIGIVTSIVKLLAGSITNLTKNIVASWNYATD